MQRQSLGSPGRGAVTVAVSTKNDVVSNSDDIKRRDSFPSPIYIAGADDEIKPEKPIHPRSEKLIHLIPILLLLCFLILYLFSHNPSPQDMYEFYRLKHPEKLIESSDIDEIGRVDNELKGGEVFAIRSLRNWKDEEDEMGRRDDYTNNLKKSSSSHRKLGDF